MANKTVYPYGTQGTLPASIGIINDCKTGGADKARAAQQGVYLDGKIDKVFGGLTTAAIDLDNYAEVGYVINSSDLWQQEDGSNNHKAKCVFIPLDGVQSVSFTASGGYGYAAFLKSTARSDGGTPDFSDDYQARFMVADGSSFEYAVPNDASFLYVQTALAAGTSIKARYDDLEFSVFRYQVVHKKDFWKEISPACSYYPLNISTGQPAGNYFGTGAYATTRYIKASGTIGITLSSLRYCSVFEYGAGFSYIKRTAIGQLTADTRTEFTLSDSTEYIKIATYYSYPDGTGDAKTAVKLDGNFPDDWDIFNQRPSDSGYMKVMVPVRVTDPTCCDEETQTVQDASQILPDYGVICLPEQYNPVGKPTRLIIHCHGAGVNYSSSVSRFDSVDLEPDYWLAEGYAVMDIEGNPFNNSDEHFWIPQAVDSYVAAYKWAIEYFNLRRDGVFLGGRSMGGGMVFALMRSQTPIPILAACPNVPSACAMGTSTAVRKEFWATHCGFEIPTGYSFGNGTYTNNDKGLFYANYDKLVKNNPILGALADLPVTAEERQTLIDCFAAYSDERVALWKTYHLLARCPVKLFGCNQDENCIPAYTSEVFYRMLINAGQVAELRLYNSYKDYTGTGTTAHHYDTQDPALRADITTSFGEELEDVPIVYIEMLAFWRRYEQGL